MFKFRRRKPEQLTAALLTVGLSVILLPPSLAMASTARLPPAPTGLRLVLGDATVSLTWDRNAETHPGFLGYRVLRRDAQQTVRVDITPSVPGGGAPVLKTNSLIDHGVQNGHAYTYWILAVDQSLVGNCAYGAVWLPLPRPQSGTSATPTTTVAVGSTS